MANEEKKGRRLPVKQEAALWALRRYIFCAVDRDSILYAPEKEIHIEDALSAIKTYFPRANARSG